ncbi:AraC family transcriptional regulator [Corynebacterium sp. A21]|uniref:AraC family transcriptional regulator n=1 Tax=Corynebacterium sp. A21 TaxID=3457318 RepID=UPI003FD2BCF0
MPQPEVDELSVISRSTGEEYFPHEVFRESAVLAGLGGLDSRDLGEVKVVRLSWGAAVRVHTEHEGGYALNIPLRGRMNVNSRAGKLTAATGQALLCPAGRELEFPHWGGDVVMLGLRIGEEFLRHQLDLAAVRDNTDPQVLDLSSGAGRQWFEFLRGVLPGDAADDGGLMSNPLVARHVSAAVASGLVSVLADAVGDSSPVFSPRVSTAMAAVEADPARAWTVSELALLAGCGVRTLQQDFRELVGESPMDHVRSVRLEVIHEELCAADPAGGDTVTDIALRWGVSHLGRFSTAYRKRFGQAPSQTLRGDGW